MEKEQNRLIDPKMTVLDVIGRFRQTEKVFRAYDDKAGICICCNALFDPLEKIAGKYGIDLNDFISDLEAAIGNQKA